MMHMQAVLTNLSSSSLLLQVSTSVQALEHLTFLQCVLDPYLEAYGMTAAALVQLPGNRKVEGR